MLSLKGAGLKSAVAMENQSTHHGSQLLKRCLLSAVTAAVVATAGVAAAQRALGPASTPAPTAAQQAAMDAAVRAYWTPERMAAAIPMERFVLQTSNVMLRPTPPTRFGAPGMARGASPEEAQANSPLIGRITQLAPTDFITQPQDFSVPGGSPLNGPWGPFQRWAHEGVDRFPSSPTATVGKLFFNIGAVPYVCSGTAINRSTVVTAGHCVAAGNGATWYNSFMFCPAYNVRAMRQVGCWGWNGNAWTSGPWFNSGNPNYDYACLVTATTGTLQANKIGNVVGWAGRAWNWANDKVEVSMGYPQDTPFAGDSLQVNAAPVWYSYAFGAATGGVGASKFMGNDLTGGSSGGPWILGYTTSFAAEISPVDSDGNTDPGGFWVNGVNSHKRCLINCNSPPLAGSGVFWNEMSSPRFTSTAADNSDSEDVFAGCFADANNNP